MAARLTGRSSGEKISASMVDRWEKGTIPRRANLRRLTAVTGGLVTFADFYVPVSATDAQRGRGARRRAA